MMMDIDVGSKVYAVAFSPTGKYLVSGGFDGVRVWRVADGKEIARMGGRNVLCVAVSKDGRSIAAGSWVGHVIVWDGQTMTTMDSEDSYGINGIDFSHDATKIVIASNNRTATVRDIPTCRRLVSIRHERLVVAAKYAPHGDRIATATSDAVRVFTADGRFMFSVVVGVTSFYHSGLLWAGRLFAISNDAIHQLESSAVVATCPVDQTSKYAAIALPKHAEFIAYAANRTVSFWDTSTHTHLALVQLPHDIRSISFSPDDQFLAIGGRDGKITVQNLSRIAESVPSPGWEPQLQISDTILDLWKRDQLTEAKALLDLAITASDTPNHHLFASRALVRARLRDWDASLADAQNAIKSRPSVMGYIAKCVAHVGKGEMRIAHRTCDITLKCFCSLQASFIRLVKAIISFMGGEHANAVSQVDQLITTPPSGAFCYIVQVYMHMHLFLGNVRMKRGDYSGAIQSFGRAHAQMRHNTTPPLVAVFLMTGWSSDNLNVTVRQRLCEAQYAAGRTKDACESVLELVHALEGDSVRRATIKWISDFTHRCLSTKSDDDATSNVEVRTSILHSTMATRLLSVWAIATLTNDKWKDAMISAASFTLPRVSIYQAVCDRLEAIARTADAIDCLQQMIKEFGDTFYKSRSITKWVCDFTQRHLSSPVGGGRAPLNATRVSLLKEWAKAKLARGSWKDAMFPALAFAIPRVAIYLVVCERLETIDRAVDAVKCFLQMMSELGGEANLHGEYHRWAVDFRQRFCKKLEHLGDAAMNAQQYNAAVTYYTAVLSLHLPLASILLKRGKALLETGSWNRALEDANKVIAFDPSSPWGYEMKHAALHKAGEYDNAIKVFEVMLSKIAHSPDPDIRQHGDRYISPSGTRAGIRRVVRRSIRHSPRVLINTTTGRLYNKTERVSVFESLPIFSELVSSMTTRIDYVHIKREVRQYFRYVMLSHKWEEKEPLFQDVVHMTVYDLEKSPTHDKLQTFCRIVKDAGFYWAWSDTCCINKLDHFVLQEALVAMFRWYQGAALMIVFLSGVRSPAHRGALVKSVWNTRAWTLQEYIASKVIHFYTEDWTLYLDLKAVNHKEAPEVILEMERATGVPADQLMALRPGLSSVREKLRLASTRQTTLVEDAAYSLLGIFSVSGVPAIYGEGEASLGRLLAHILAGSGDVNILAWSGESGGFNSCLPAHIIAFNGPATSHLPRSIPDVELDSLIAASPLSASDLDVAMRLYDRLNELPTPWFAASRMKLPCIAFQLPPLSPYRARSGRAYRADTVPFGRMEIRTRQDLSRMASLWLVHPWLDALLEREGTHMDAHAAGEGRPTSPEDEDDVSEEGSSLSHEGHSAYVPSAPAPISVPAPTMDRETRARRLVGRLKQPFGALLVTLVATGRQATDYRRVAADSVICVRFREGLGLGDILDGVRTLDVL